ncbi:MAG: aminoglycoside phosphotransferase family protein [Phycisphaerales bacterium]|nr:MAG: aminoglycoside phosphotransferase family protein [Phycisphaerales bacterium]
MLSPADADLVARDQRLPGLALLFDETALSEEIKRRCPAATIGDLRANYVRYKPGTSCIVGYSARSRSGETVLYARTHTPSASAKIEKVAAQGHVDNSIGFGAITIASPPMAVYAFPNDHELRCLPHLQHPQRRRALLHRALYDSLPAGDIGYEPLRYKPERRYVARVSGGSGLRLRLKFYIDRDFELAKSNARAVNPSGPLRFAPVAGHSDRRKVLAFDWVEGTSLREIIRSGCPRPELVASTGAALAHLHRCKPTKRMRRAWTPYARQSVIAGEAVAAIRPDLGQRVEAVVHRFNEELSDDRPPPTAIHGDLSADQILVSGEEIVLLDLDRARAGHPQVDIGSFAANLLVDAFCGRLPKEAVPGITASLLDGYRHEAGIDLEPRIQRFIAANLLRLAVEPFRLRHRDWSDVVEAILGHAEELVYRGD